MEEHEGEDGARLTARDRLAHTSQDVSRAPSRGRSPAMKERPLPSGTLTGDGVQTPRPDLVAEEGEDVEMGEMENAPAYTESVEEGEAEEDISPENMDVS